MINHVCISLQQIPKPRGLCNSALGPKYSDFAFSFVLGSQYSRRTNNACYTTSMCDPYHNSFPAVSANVFKTLLTPHVPKCWPYDIIISMPNRQRIWLIRNGRFHGMRSPHLHIYIYIREPVVILGTAKGVIEIA